MRIFASLEGRKPCLSMLLDVLAYRTYEVQLLVKVQSKRTVDEGNSFLLCDVV